MKQPQCNTSADCLRELARIMDQFGIGNIYDALHSGYILHNWRRFYDVVNPDFDVPTNWQFAIAEVEGKPVFIGDELYYAGNKYRAKRAFKNIKGVVDAIETEDRNIIFLDNLSWNPPKPATVMVELPYDYARNRAAQNCTPDATLVNACKTALDKLKS